MWLVDRKIPQTCTRNDWTWLKTKTAQKPASCNLIKYQILFLLWMMMTTFSLSETQEPLWWNVQSLRTDVQPWVSFQNSRHCGMGICSSLSLDFQHMSGWPCSAYYSNLRAIDSNSLFLLLWNFISPSPVSEMTLKSDPKVCCGSCCVSLSDCLQLFLGGLESLPE